MFCRVDESSGLICDICVKPVDEEEGFAGICRGQLCENNEVHMCRKCAYSVDESLNILYCRECLDQHKGEDYLAPTYAEVVEVAQANSPRSQEA